MPTIKILNRDYQINCGPGEEKKLYELAAKLSNRLQDNEKVFRGASEGLLIILTSLILEDQNHDLQHKLDEATTAIEKLCKLLEE
jgi:cell division protein ZapA